MKVTVRHILRQKSYIYFALKAVAVITVSFNRTGLQKVGTEWDIFQTKFNLASVSIFHHFVSAETNFTGHSSHLSWVLWMAPREKSVTKRK